MPLPSPYPVVGGTTIASAWGTAVVDGLPQIGFVGMWVGDTAPPDYLLCRGQAVSRTTYLALWNLCKTATGVGRFGDGDGSTTFNVPDLRGRYPFGHNVGPTSSLNPNAGTFGQLGVGQVFGNKDATALAPHTHVTPNHLHAFNGWTGPERQQHDHLVPWGEVWQQWSGAEDNIDSFRIALTSGGFSIVIHKFQSSSYPTTAERQAHDHDINGMTTGSDRDLTTTTTGTDVTNGNLPPSLSLNFIVRYA